MGLLIKCDSVGCGNTTDYDHPGFMWLKSERLSPERTFGDDGPTHYYCSYQCEHNHSYLLISGDNGK